MKNVMLDILFGENRLAEAESICILKENMWNSITLLSQMEEGCLSTQLPKDENGKFEICIIY